MSRIYQYPVVTEIGSDDYLALGSATNGSRAILASDLAPVIGSKTITERGTYKASDDNMDGYGQVTVDIPYTDIHVASGDIATFEGEDLPLKSLKVAVTPYQDLHGYDAPWAGGAGKNLVHVDSKIPTVTISNVEYSSDDEYIYLNGTKQGGGYADLSSLSITLDSGTYYIKAFVISGTATNAVELYPYDGTNSLTGTILNIERTLTFSESKTFRFRFAIWTDGTVLSNYKIGIVISKTSGIDKFYPYSNICPIIGWDEANVTVADDVETPTVSNVYTIDLDGTRYGGTLDATNGIMTVDREIKTLSASDSFSITNNGERSRISWDDYTYIGKTAGYFIANRLTPKEPSPGGYGSNIWEVFGSSVAPRCWITAPISITTVSDFTTWLANNPVQLVYELATPITVQLAPTLVKSLEGENNISANCGAVDVEYQTVWVRPTN